MMLLISSSLAPKSCLDMWTSTLLLMLLMDYGAVTLGSGEGVGGYI